MLCNVMLWYVMLCYGMYVMVGIYVCMCMYVCMYGTYILYIYIYTHTHKRTLEYIQLLFGLHSLRHAMIILLSHLMSINYSNWVQPGNHHQIINSSSPSSSSSPSCSSLLPLSRFYSLSLWCCYVYVYVDMYIIY